MNKRIKVKQSRAKTTRLTPSAKLLQAVTPHLHLDDRGGVMVALATVVVNTWDGERLWLLLVNPASSGKTEIVQLFDQVDFCDWLAEITDNTFLSGLRDTNQGSHTNPNRNSLLHRLTDPDLRGERPPCRIILIQDLTGLITSRRDKRDAIFGQLRQIYDGRLVKATGMGDDLIWEGYLGLLGAVTPAYDEVAELNSILGERFILYRPERINIEEEARRAANRKTTDWRKKVAKVAKTCVDESIKWLPKVKIPKKANERLLALAQFTAEGRTAVPRDGYTKVLKSLPQPEGPSRLVQQFKKLLHGLCAVQGRSTPREKELAIIAKVARDTMPNLRLTVIAALYRGGGMVSALVEATNLPNSTLTYQLEDLRVLKVAKLVGGSWELVEAFRAQCDRARVFQSLPETSKQNLEKKHVA